MRTHFAVPLLLMTCVVQNAVAQPPEPKRAPALAPAPPVRVLKPRVGTPEELLTQDVKAFVAELNGENPFYGAERYIWEARIGYFGANEWQKWWLGTRRTRSLGVTEVRVLHISATDAEINLVYRYTQGEPRTEGPFHLKFGFSPLDSEKVENKVWQFVPQAPQDEEFLAVSPLRWAVWMLGQSPQALTSFRGVIAEQQLKVLSLGVMQLVQDYDETYAFLPEFQEEALEDYLKDPPLWTVPGTKEKFLFNGRLSGKNLAQVADAARTILFYDGEGEKPVYRYDGKTAVALSDGHVELTDPERFKTFLWE